MAQDGFIAEKELAAENEIYMLRYYTDEIVTENARVYGLRAEKYLNGRRVESERTPALFDNRAQADSLALRFAEGRVTPFVLCEMADECL